MYHGCKRLATLATLATPLVNGWLVSRLRTNTSLTAWINICSCLFTWLSHRQASNLQFKKKLLYLSLCFFLHLLVQFPFLKMLKSFGASLVSTTIKGFDAPLTRGLLGAVWSWCASIQLVFQTLCSFLLLCSFASIQLVFQTVSFAPSAKRERLHYQQNICTQRFSAFTVKGLVNPRSSSQNQITNSHPLSNLPVTGIYTMPPGYLDLSVLKCTISQSHLNS